MRRGLAIPTALLGGALLSALLPGAQPAPAAEDAGAAATTVRIGLLGNLFRDAPEPLIQVLAKPFKSLMEDQAGFVAQVVVGGDAEAMAVQIKEGKIEIAVFQGFEFAWARLKNPELKPLLICVNQQPFARSVLVVHQDCKATRTDDLHGKILAMPRLAREHARIFVERRCVQPGMPMDKWFDKVMAPRTASDALDDVAENLAQATVVDDLDLEAFRKTYPKTASRLRVLLESETFPCAVIAYQPGTLDPTMLLRLRAGMIAAKTTTRGSKLLEMCRITSFEAIPANYEQNLADILKAYPPPTK